MIVQSALITRSTERTRVEHKPHAALPGASRLARPALGPAPSWPGPALSTPRRLEAHRAMWRTTRSNRVQIDGHDMHLDRRRRSGNGERALRTVETAWYSANVSQATSL